MSYTTEGILEAMKNPELLTPRTVFESYAFLASTLSDEQMQLAELEGRLAKMEADYIGEGRTSAAAIALTRGSEMGVEARKLRAIVTGHTECIRALKKAQAYFSDEAKSLF